MRFAHFNYVFSNRKETTLEISCCVCKKMLVDGQWIESTPLVPYRVSHGYCPVCIIEARKQLNLSLEINSINNETIET